MIKMDTPLYVQVIDLMVKDAFPGQKVEVAVESSVFHPGMVAVTAFVDGFYGAYVTVPAAQLVYESEIASVLIDMLQDKMRKEKEI